MSLRTADNYDMLSIVNWTLVVLPCAWISWRWAKVLTAGMSAALTFLVAGLLLEMTAGAAVAWLGLFGVLSRGSQMTLLILLAVVTWLVTRRAGGDRLHLKGCGESVSRAGGARASCRRISAPARLASVVAVTISVAAGAIVSLNQIRYVSTDADSMFYHLPMVAEWVRSGSIWPSEAIRLVARAYPGFKESAITALSLPLHNEHLALWAPVEFGLLGLLTFCLARQSGARRTSALATVAYVLTAPVVANSFVDQGDTDIPLAIATCASVMFLSMLVRKPGWRPALLAGLALGATAAVKFSGVIYVGIVVAVAAVHSLFVLRHRRLACLPSSHVHTPRVRYKPWCRGGALLLAAGVLIAGPWYIRNLIACRNPLYPADIRVGGVLVFAGPMSQVEVALTSLGWNIGPLVEYARYFTDAFGLLTPVIGLSTLWLMIAVGLRRQRLVRVLPLVLVPPLLAIAFLHHPYNQPSPFGFDYNMRYLISCFVLCVCGLTAAVARCRSLARLLTVLLLLGAVWNLRAWTNWWWLLTGLAVVVGAAATLRPEAINHIRSVWWACGARRLRPATLWLLAGLVLISAGWRVDRMRTRLQYDPDYGYGRITSQPGWGAIVSDVHRNIRKSRLAVVGEVLLFPLYGDDSSNRLHVLPWAATAEEVLASCDSQGIDYVAAFAPRGARNAEGRFELGESVAHELLRRHPDRFVTVLESSGSFLLRVTDRPQVERLEE